MIRFAGSKTGGQGVPWWAVSVSWRAWFVQLGWRCVAGHGLALYRGQWAQTLPDGKWRGFWMERIA